MEKQVETLCSSNKKPNGRLTTENLTPLWAKKEMEKINVCKAVQDMINEATEKIAEEKRQAEERAKKLEEENKQLEEENRQAEERVKKLEAEKRQLEAENR